MDEDVGVQLARIEAMRWEGGVWAVTACYVATVAAIALMVIWGPW